MLQVVAGVTKVKTLSKGDKASAHPNFCSQVVLQIVQQQAGGKGGETAADTLPAAQVRTVRLGSGAVPQALEMALQAMKPNEVARFRFNQDTFASDAHVPVPTSSSSADEEDGAGPRAAVPMVARWRPAPASASAPAPTSAPAAEAGKPAVDAGGSASAGADAAASPPQAASPGAPADTDAATGISGAWPWPEVVAASAAATAALDDGVELTIKLLKSCNPDDLNGDGVLLRYCGGYDTQLLLHAEHADRLLRARSKKKV